MPTSINTQNRHPVDRLFDLREQIKALQAEADTLKNDILRSESYVGAEYLAIPKSSTRTTLDRPALEAKFGKAAIDACSKESSFITINLFRKADIGRD